MKSVAIPAYKRFLCFCFLFLHHVYPMLPVSLDCSFLICPSVFSNVYVFTLVTSTKCNLSTFNENFNKWNVFTKSLFVANVIRFYIHKIHNYLHKTNISKRDIILTINIVLLIECPQVKCWLTGNVCLLLIEEYYGGIIKHSRWPFFQYVSAYFDDNIFPHQSYVCSCPRFIAVFKPLQSLIMAVVRYSCTSN